MSGSSGGGIQGLGIQGLPIVPECIAINNLGTYPYFWPLMPFLDLLILFILVILTLKKHCFYLFSSNKFTS